MSSNQENIGIPLRCIPHFIGINPKAFRDIFDPLKNNQSTPTIYEAAKTTSNIVDSKSVNDLFNKLNAKKTLSQKTVLYGKMIWISF